MVLFYSFLLFLGQAPIPPSCWTPCLCNKQLSLEEYLEYHRNTAADFVQIYRMFSRFIPMKYHSFFGEKNRNSYGIFVAFSWNFSCIFTELQSKKTMRKVLLQNITSVFAEFFMNFLILLYRQKSMEKAQHCRNWTLIAQLKKYEIKNIKFESISMAGACRRFFESCHQAPLKTNKMHPLFFDCFLLTSWV